MHFFQHWQSSFPIFWKGDLRLKKVKCQKKGRKTCAGLKLFEDNHVFFNPVKEGLFFLKAGD